MQQTGALSISEIQGQHVKPFSLLDSVRLNGDGTFSYEFQLVASTKGVDDFEHVLGDYRVRVHEHFGDAYTYFKVVDDPENFVDKRTPLGLIIDKSESVLGTSITFSGKVLDYEYRGNQQSQYVEFTFIDPNGRHVMVEDNDVKRNDFNYEANSPNEKLTIRAIPDSLGLYEASLVLTPIQFEYGKYTVVVTHPYSKISESLDFVINSAQSEIISQTENDEPLVMELCKSNRLHVDEILKSVKQIGRGEIPPSMDSVDCSENLVFNVGDKLVVIGKVQLKTGVNLDQSSTQTSGQTQQGSSYSTNYAQAAMNYVDVSIPYPYSLNIVKSSNYQTIPDENENYTGGGGSGEGGSFYIDKDGNVIRNDVCEASAAGACTGTTRSDRMGEGSYDGSAVLKKQKLLLTDMKHKAYPDDEGNFATVFEFSLVARML